jgi:hypothetical protein
MRDLVVTENSPQKHREEAENNREWTRIKADIHGVALENLSAYIRVNLRLVSSFVFSVSLW